VGKHLMPSESAVFLLAPRKSLEFDVGMKC